MSLFTSELQAHLTSPNPELSRMAGKTEPGMAHFAGTGPHAKTCFDCALWGLGGSFDYHSKNGLRGGRIKPHPCSKYRQLMQGRVGSKVSDSAQACKYFEQNLTQRERFSK